MELRSNIKLLNYARKFLLNETENILPYPVRPQKPQRTGRMPAPLPRTTPEAAGVPAAALNALFRGLAGAENGTHSCIVVRDGKVIAEGGFAPYTPRIWHVTHSLCKSVTGAAIGMLTDEGLLSLDTRVCDIFPEKCSLLTSRRMRAVTVRHLLTMTSGVAFKEAGSVLESDWSKAFLDADVLFEPGTQFDYNSMNSYMLSAIVRKKTGRGLMEYLRPRLFDPLGFGSVAWETCPQGIEKGGWGMYVFLEDMVKLGLVYMNRGVWTDADGRSVRILSEAWVEEATRPDTVHENGEEYGFQLWPHSIDHTYLFNGMFGQYVVVAPELALIVAVNAGAGNLFTHSQTYKEICSFIQAVADAPVPLPPQEEDAARLRFTLAHLRFGEDIPEIPRHTPTPWYVWAQKKLSAFQKKPAPSPIPDAARPLLARHYTFPKNRAGLLPAVLGCMEDWYTRGVERVAFAQRGDALTLLWTSGNMEARVPIGLKGRPAVSLLDFGGNCYEVAVSGKFATDEDDHIVLKLTFCFLESSSTRFVKCAFDGAGGLTLKLDESPSLLVAMQSLAETMRTQSAGTDWFKDLDYLHYLVRRVCLPVAVSTQEEETTP